MAESPSVIEDYIRSPVRPLVTLAFAGTLCYLAIIGIISTEAFLPIVALVFNWWFNERRDQHQAEAMKESVKDSVKESVKSP